MKGDTMKAWIIALTLLTGVVLAGNGLATERVAHNGGQSASAVSAEEKKYMAKQGIQQVRLSVGNKKAVVVLDDNPASRDFLSMLPLTLTFEDYNGTEKIGSLPRKLKAQDAPTSCDPDVGSFTYYAPWGNLAIFYRDFRHSNGLVPLGRVESGMEVLADMRDGVSIRLEKME